MAAGGAATTAFVVVAWVLQDNEVSVLGLRTSFWGWGLALGDGAVRGSGGTASSPTTRRLGASWFSLFNLYPRQPKGRAQRIENGLGGGGGGTEDSLSLPSESST